MDEVERSINQTDDELLADATRAGQDFVAAVEMVRRLKDETVNQQKVMTKLTRVMLFLTWVILVLAAVEAGTVIGPLTVKLS